MAVSLKRKKIRSFLQGALFVAICIVALPQAYEYLKIYVSSDPFKTLFAKTKSDIAESVGIRMDGVELRDYHGAKLVSRANARRIDISQDRQTVNLYDVTNGRYDGEKGKFTYRATEAIWSLAAKIVTVNKSVDVHGKDIDLHAKGLSYNDRSGLMRISGDVTGRLYQGQVRAAALKYNMDSGAAEAGPIDWKGKIDLGVQDDAQAGPRVWDIHGAHSKIIKNIGIYQNATASDGDLIVKAPTVEHDQKTDVLTCTGGVEYYSSKANMTADKCVIFRKDKHAILTGHVVMFVKPKSDQEQPPKVEKLPVFQPVTPDKVVASHPTTPPDKDTQKEMEDEVRSSKNLRDFPMVVVSEEVVYYYAKGSRHAIITGAPQGRQTLKGDQWRHLWSHEAFYDGEKETLKLVSTEKKKDTIMKNSLGDVMIATDITVSTKEGDDEMDCSDPEGKMTTYDDEIPRDDKSKGSDKGTPPPTKGVGGGTGTGNGTGV